MRGEMEEEPEMTFFFDNLLFLQRTTKIMTRTIKNDKIPPIIPPQGGVDFDSLGELVDELV